MSKDKRAAMISGLAEWAGSYPDAAELLFHSPEEYADWVDGFYTDYDRGFRDDETVYWVNADEARRKMVTAIETLFQLKAAE